MHPKPRPLRWAAWLWATWSLAACASHDATTDLAVRIRLVDPGTKDADWTPLEADEVAVRVRVEADDLAQPVVASWVGSADDDVTLSLSVPAGQGRRLVAVVFVRAGPHVRTYRGLVEDLDLGPGEADVAVDAQLAPTWSLELLVQGADGLGQVAAVDVETGLAWPPVDLEQRDDGRHAVLSDLPVGRFFYLVFRDSETSEWSEPADFCPIYSGQAWNQYRVVDLAERTCRAGR